MKTTFAIFLLASLATSVALLARFVATGAVEPETRASFAFATGSSIDFGADVAADDVAKFSFLHALEKEYLAPFLSSASSYWIASDNASLQQLHDGALESIRRELKAQFGPQAEHDQFFAALFRPLDPVFSFLTSEQQLAVQALKRQRELMLRKAAQRAQVSAGAGQGAGQIPGDEVRKVEQVYRSALRKLFDEATLFEFELRDAPIAHELRGTGVTFTEQEFRDTFRVMQELQEATGIDATLLARQELGSILGERRFAQLWSARDPVMARLQVAAERLDIHDAAMRAIYEALNRFEERRMQAVKLAEVDPLRAAEELDVLRNEERQVVASIVGPEAAEELLRARALESLEMTGAQQQWRARP